MRKNEYTSLDQFTSQYTGEWSPSEGHWYGLDFLYTGKQYRFNTGTMFNSENTILKDGREAVFGLYLKNLADDSYILLEEFATINDALESCCIEGKPFKEIIVDGDTELVGQDQFITYLNNILLM